jgi:hypothetical protein
LFTDIEIPFANPSFLLSVIDGSPGMGGAVLPEDAKKYLPDYTTFGFVIAIRTIIVGTGFQRERRFRVEKSN